MHGIFHIAVMIRDKPSLIGLMIKDRKLTRFLKMYQKPLTSISIKVYSHNLVHSGKICILQFLLITVFAILTVDVYHMNLNSVNQQRNLDSNSWP